MQHYIETRIAVLSKEADEHTAAAKRYTASMATQSAILEAALANQKYAVCAELSKAKEHYQSTIAAVIAALNN